DAAGQPPPHAARSRWGSSRFIRRQQREDRRSLRSRRAVSNLQETHMHCRRLSGFVLLVLGIAGLALAAERASLADAVEQRDTARVRALLEARVDVNAAQIDGTTALHWAAYQDDAE